MSDKDVTTDDLLVVVIDYLAALQQDIHSTNVLLESHPCMQHTGYSSTPPAMVEYGPAQYHPVLQRYAAQRAQEESP